MPFKIEMRLTDYQVLSAARWMCATGETDPKAIQTPVVRARFETFQAPNPDKIPTDPISIFEIETYEPDLFMDTPMVVGRNYILGVASITVADAPAAEAPAASPVPLIPVEPPPPPPTPLPSPGF